MGILKRLLGGGKSSPVQDLLRQQRKNSETCISILTRCTTRQEILDGFGKTAGLLRQSGDPLAESADRIALLGEGLSDEEIQRLKEDFIAQCRSFLSATDRGI